MRRVLPKSKGAGLPVECNSRQLSRRRLRARGVALPFTEIGIALFVVACVLACRWSSVAPAVHAVAIICLIFGALLITPAAGSALIQALEPPHGSNQPPRRSTIGERLLRKNKLIFGTAHDYRPAIESDFDGLDRGFYDQTAVELRNAGCRLIGDVVNTTVEKQKNMRAVARVMVAPDETIVVSITHVVFTKPTRLHPTGEAKLYEAATEFEDGTFLITNNSTVSGIITAPPKIQKIVVPATTAPLDVLAMHSNALQRIFGKAPRKVGSLNEELDRLRRESAIVCTHRKEIGYLDPEQIRRLALAMGKSRELADEAARSADEARRFELASRRSLDK